MAFIKIKKTIIIFSIVAISISQYLCFLGLGLNSSGEHDDLFMFMRSSQYLRHYNKAIDTELPKQNLPEQLSNDERFKKRFDVSASLWKTYTLTSLLYNIPVLFNDVINKDNSIVNYSSQLVTMLVSSFIVTFLIFLWILKRFLDKQMALYILITLIISTAIFFISINFWMTQYDAHLFGKDKGIIDFLKRIIMLPANPRYQFHFFSFTPRNQFCLMLFTTFLLRWSDRYKLSYWVLFIGFLFHAAMGIIFFLFIFLIDLIRKILFNQNNFNIIVIFLIPLLFIVRSDLLFVLLPSFSLSSIHFLLLIAIFIVVVYIFQYIIKNILIKIPLPENISSKINNPIIGDIIIFFCIWLIGLPLAIYFNNIADDFSSVYLWSQILGRPLAMMHGPLLLAFVIYIYGWIEKSNILSKYYHNIVWGKILLTGFYLILIVWFSSGVYLFNRGYSTFSVLTDKFVEKLDEPFIPLEPNERNEAFLLYTSIRSFDDNKDYFQQILASKK